MTHADPQVHSRYCARRQRITNRFKRDSEPPEPKFPGAGALRDHLALILPEGGERPLHIAA
jgi:hypothetical protein